MYLVAIHGCRLVSKSALGSYFMRKLIIWEIGNADRDRSGAAAGFNTGKGEKLGSNLGGGSIWVHCIAVIVRGIPDN